MWGLFGHWRLAWTILVLAVPVGVSAQSTLRLAWDPPATAVSGYRVTYTVQPAGPSRVIDIGNTTSVTLTGLELGRWYNVAVAAYNAGGVGQPAQVSTFTTAIAGLTASQTGAVAPGSTVTWTATPPPGSPALEYQFWLLRAGSWQMVRGYATQNSFSWTPSMSDVGTHALQVWARQLGSTASYEAYRGTGIFEVALKPFTVTAVVSNGRSPFPTGGPITWNAIVQPVDVTNALEYQFWLLNRATGTWSIARSYGSGATFTWTPGWLEAGDYVIQVWARYPGTTVNYAGWAGAAFKVQRGIGTLSTNVSYPVPPGTPITWTANAGASSPSVQYQFWRYSQGSWQMVRDYSTTRTYSWTPGDGDLGSHALQVWARSSGSTATHEAWRGTGLFDVSRTPPLVAAIGFSSPPVAGSATTISATASGGYNGPLQYRFWQYSAATGWTMIRDYSSGSTATWTPSTRGGYAIQVWVRSAGSTSNYEAWLGTNVFTVP